VERFAGCRRASGIFFGLIQGRCLTAAVELGLANVIATSPLPVEIIAAQTKSEADNCSV
jgi:hypothetical protein